jgi:hypothetical protein
MARQAVAEQAVHTRLEAVERVALGAAAAVEAQAEVRGRATGAPDPALQVGRCGASP